MPFHRRRSASNKRGAASLSDGLGFRYCCTAMTLVQLWHSFLALHPWGYVITAVALAFGFIKRKAISAATSAAAKEAEETFFRWFSKNLPGQKPTHEKWGGPLG
jgi:hypothetical protein